MSVARGQTGVADEDGLGVEETARLQTLRGTTGPLWRYAALRAWHGFVRHRGIDSAAALTFFSALALFPGALTLVSAVSIVSDRERAVESILSVVNEFTAASTVDTVEQPLRSFLNIDSPGIALAVGIVLLVWSLSAYATAFGRTVNSVYEILEGRQFWKFRGLMLLVTMAIVPAFGAICLILLSTPRVVEAAGVGEPWALLWNVGKWPLLAALAVVVVAVLYYYTPNVRHNRLRWVSWGAMFAIVVWALATVGFGVYVFTVGQYERVYGWIGGGIVLLIWLYISNLVLVIGAEVDAEIVRLRQLTAGIEAEGVIQLPLRDTTRNLVLARQRASDEQRGRAIREAANEAHDILDRRTQGL
jgi:membrane protein